MTVDLVVGSCAVRQPVVTVVPPQCVAGVVTPGTVVPEGVDGVSYTVEPPEGPYEVGDTVTVRATLASTQVGWASPLAVSGCVTRRRRRITR